MFASHGIGVLGDIARRTLYALVASRIGLLMLLE